MNDSLEVDNKKILLYISLQAVLLLIEILARYLNKICGGQNTPAEKTRVNATENHV